MSDPRYKHKDVVWCKCGGLFWPGEVRGLDSLPEEIRDGFLKMPLVVVKFFDEDGYEFVLNDRDIYPYNCDKKEQFILKGLARCRTKSKEGVTGGWFAKFPKDVIYCEGLTGGDPDILRKEPYCDNKNNKVDYKKIFGDPTSVDKKQQDRNVPSKQVTGGKTPKGSSASKSSFSSPVKSKAGGSKKAKTTSKESRPHPARPITHPRFLNKSDHEVRILTQPSTPYHIDLQKKEEQKSDVPAYRCPMCNFATTRLNVIVIHTKIHSKGPQNRPQAESLVVPKQKTKPFRDERVSSTSAKKKDKVGTAKKSLKRAAVGAQNPSSPAAKKPRLTKKEKEEKKEQEKKREMTKRSLLDDWSEDETQEMEECKKLQESIVQSLANWDNSDDEFLKGDDEQFSYDSDEEAPTIGNKPNIMHANSILEKSKLSGDLGATFGMGLDSEGSKSAHETVSKFIMSTLSSSPEKSTDTSTPQKNSPTSSQSPSPVPPSSQSATSSSKRSASPFGLTPDKQSPVIFSERTPDTSLKKADPATATDKNRSPRLNMSSDSPPKSNPSFQRQTSPGGSPPKSDKAASPSASKLNSLSPSGDRKRSLTPSLPSSAGGRGPRKISVLSKRGHARGESKISPEILQKADDAFDINKILEDTCLPELPSFSSTGKFSSRKLKNTKSGESSPDGKQKSNGYLDHSPDPDPPKSQVDESLPGCTSVSKSTVSDHSSMNQLEVQSISTKESEEHDTENGSHKTLDANDDSPAGRKNDDATESGQPAEHDNVDGEVSVEDAAAVVENSEEDDGSDGQIYYMLVDDNSQLEHQTILIEESQLAAVTGGQVLNSSGQIITQDGNVIIQGNGGPIIVSGSSLTSQSGDSAANGHILVPSGAPGQYILQGSSDGGGGVLKTVSSEEDGDILVVTTTEDKDNQGVSAADTSGGVATIPSHPSSPVFSQVPLITTRSVQQPIMVTSAKSNEK